MKLRLLFAFCALTCVSFAQTWSTPLESRVSGLEFHTAKSSDAVLSAALETMFRNPEVCCGKYSALVDVVDRMNPNSLQDISTKLQGRHVLGDGRPIQVIAKYYPALPTDGKMPADFHILPALQINEPLLMLWNSKLYVIYGALYTEYSYNDLASGSSNKDTIEKLYLFDPSTGQQTTFERTRDDWREVQGLLMVSSTPSSS